MTPLLNRLASILVKSEDGESLPNHSQGDGKPAMVSRPPVEGTYPQRLEGINQVVRILGSRMLKPIRSIPQDYIGY